MGPGPARELHRGSGYLSQDSAVQVMARNANDNLSVRWPGGRMTTNAVPENAREVLVNSAGTLTVIH
jgi:hypothetical protein